MIDIETPRLRLRALEKRDLQDMFEIFSDEQWCLQGGGFHAYKEAASFEERFETFLTQSRYAVVLKEENKAVGIVSVSKANRAVPAYEIGFGIHPRYQRRGYAYEAVSHFIRALFAGTDAEMLVASHFPANAASRTLIEKLGFTHEGTLRKAHSHALYGSVDLESYYMEKPARPFAGLQSSPDN